MFTGIIETTASIQSITESTLMIQRPVEFDDVHIGSSIAVSGICLTVAELSDAALHFDLSSETLAKTTLHMSTQDDKLNLERALPANGRFDGHVVQGHVEGISEVLKVNESRLTVKIPDDQLPFIIPKGSLALDGVSLTVAELYGANCTVALIPHTLVHTTLGSVVAGDQLNLETDVLVRSVHSLLLQ